MPAFVPYTLYFNESISVSLAIPNVMIHKLRCWLRTNEQDTRNDALKYLMATYPGSTPAICWG